MVSLLTKLVIVSPCAAQLGVGRLWRLMPAIIGKEVDVRDVVVGLHGGAICARMRPRLAKSADLRPEMRDWIFQSGLCTLR